MKPIKLNGPGVRVLEGENLQQVSLPLGGIGTGCVNFTGQGGLRDFALGNKPELAVARHAGGRFVGYGVFATLRTGGKKGVARVVEGPLPRAEYWNQGLHSGGGIWNGSTGFPHFRSARFSGAYPFGQVRLRDPAIPLKVSVTAYNPFIPGDVKHSGLPAAILEYTLSNPGKKAVPLQLAVHSDHFARIRRGDDKPDTSRNALISGKGVFLYNEEPIQSEGRGSVALVSLGPKPARLKSMFFRGGWFDGYTQLWREVESGDLTANNGREAEGSHGHNGGSILFEARLRPGETITIPVAFCWHFPNVHYYTGPGDQGVNCCDGEDARGRDPEKAPYWRPGYVKWFQDAKEVGLYLCGEYESLRARTLAFQKTLFASTLPEPVLDAVSANLGILKSPTSLLQENGNFWGWEGCHGDAGCCPGTCTHVWNYAQALPHLFPGLERSLREQEWEQSMDAQGHVNFRSALPTRETDHNFHPAADGQLGGLLKLYRDWHICGDDAWLRRLYPLARRSLEYCITRWDPELQGVLTEPHHNTYDIEFWGPDGMCGTIYAGALSAMARMAAHLGEADDATRYNDLAEKGCAYLDKHLFNGEYYHQQVRWKGALEESFQKEVLDKAGSNKAVLALLKKEGPKYQYGLGCLADGVIGAWMARLYGVDAPFNTKRVRKHLKAVFKHNFRKDLREHVNPQRAGFALGEDAGLLLCTWPKGSEPSFPFPYSNEVWWGIEYQVATHLILEGHVAEGEAIVKAARARVDGLARSPWCEYECGNHYARSLSSYALLQAYSGLRYSKVERTLWLAPRIAQRPFRTFFAVADGFGLLTLSKNKLRVEMVEGRLELARLVVAGFAEMDLSEAPATVQPGEVLNLGLSRESAK